MNRRGESVLHAGGFRTRRREERDAHRLTGFVQTGINWKLQLNVRNLLDQADLIPVIASPDGSVPVVEHCANSRARKPCRCRNGLRP